MLKIKLKKKFYDIKPKSRDNLVDLRCLEGTAVRKMQWRLFKKLTALILIVMLNWLGFLTVGQTLGYFSDYELSINNTYAAGVLDFELASESNFTPAVIPCHQSAARDIEVLNYGNLFKYTVTAKDFSSPACKWLNIKVSLDGGPVIYHGSLKDFRINQDDLVFFAEPEIWHFEISSNKGMPCCWQQKECSFKLVFKGSQIRHDLAFPVGFSDTEEIENTVTLKKACSCVCMKSINYWKKNAEIYKNYLPLDLGCQTINFIEEANEILIKANSSLQDRLKAQLLAFKFNLAHFGVADYEYAKGKTLADAAAQADSLLCAETQPPIKDLKKMVNLLSHLNCLCFWFCPAELAAENEANGQAQCAFQEVNLEDEDTDTETEIEDEATEYLEGIDINVEGQPLFDESVEETIDTQENASENMISEEETEGISENLPDAAEIAVDLSEEIADLQDEIFDIEADAVLDTDQILLGLQEQTQAASEDLKETASELLGALEANLTGDISEAMPQMPQMPQDSSQKKPIEVPAQPEPVSLQNEDAIIKDPVAAADANLNNEL